MLIDIHLESAPVEFTNDLHPRIKIRPMYFEMGFSSSPKIFARQAILNKVISMLERLPTQYGLLIYDVYRPRAVQAVLFDWMRNEVRKKMPHLSEQENFAETKKYAALPAKIGDSYCSPHLSGGAIDLTLTEIVSGEPCDMGTPFDDCTDKAHHDYFDKHPPVTEEDRRIKKRRELLRSVMESVGFTAHQYEWWHYDMGNVLWSKMTGQPEIFGPLFGDKEWPV